MSGILKVSNGFKKGEKATCVKDLIILKIDFHQFPLIGLLEE